MREYEDVLRFWFGETPADTADALFAKIKRWYSGGPDMDSAVRERFGSQVADALAGGLETWEAEPRPRLALVLILDQFTRNLYRGTARAYAADARAQRLAVDAFDRHLTVDLGIEERNFFLMPLVHSEDLSLHDRAVVLMDQLVADAPPALRPIWSMGVEQSRKYRSVIARFGRFPFRNQALGRASTPEEEQFLATELANMPPAAMRDHVNPAR